MSSKKTVRKTTRASRSRDKGTSRPAATKKKNVTRKKTAKKVAKKRATRKKDVSAENDTKKRNRLQPATTPKQVHRLLGRLRAAHPEARTALVHDSAFELLVATILSAQCTDERVNKVTPKLFARFPTAAELAAAEAKELEEIIHSTGFFRNKAKNLIGMAQRLVRDHGGEVPAELAALVALPGVARKTANVVLGSFFGITAGVVVDTHVARLSQRLGLTSQKDAIKIERDLMARFPESSWVELSHLLIFHGRKTCIARRPQCDACAIVEICPSAFRLPPWI